MLPRKAKACFLDATRRVGRERVSGSIVVRGSGIQSCNSVDVLVGIGNSPLYAAVVCCVGQNKTGKFEERWIDLEDVASNQEDMI